MLAALASPALAQVAGPESRFEVASISCPGPGVFVAPRADQDPKTRVALLMVRPSFVPDPLRVQREHFPGSESDTS